MEDPDAWHSDILRTCRQMDGQTSASQGDQQGRRQGPGLSDHRLRRPSPADCMPRTLGMDASTRFLPGTRRCIRCGQGLRVALEAALFYTLLHGGWKRGLKGPVR